MLLACAFGEKKEDEYFEGMENIRRANDKKRIKLIKSVCTILIISYGSKQGTKNVVVCTARDRLITPKVILRTQRAKVESMRKNNLLTEDNFPRLRLGY